MANPFDKFDETNVFDKFDAPKAEPVSDFSGNLRLGNIDIGIPLPQVVNKGLAQFGSGLADWVLGAQQIAGKATKADADEKRKLDKELIGDSYVGKSLNIAGQVAPSFALPFGYLGALGRAAPAVEGAIAGVTQGALQPTGTGESRATNMVVGGGAGAALPTAVQGFRALATPSNTTLADKAINQYNIPLGVADVSDSKLVKGARSILNDLPVTGYMGANSRDAVQQAFNREVGATFGAPVTKLDPAAMQGAKQRLGSEFDRIWGNNHLAYDGQLFTELNALRGNAAKLPQGDSARLTSWIDDIESKMVPDASGGLVMPGDVANRMQSKIRQQSDLASGFLKDDLTTLRKSVLGAFNRNVSPADATSLAENMRKYRAFKTVEPLMNKGEAGIAGRTAGDVPASLLPNQVFSQYGNQVAQSPFADLAPIGARYIVDRTPQTGGSVRAALQNGGVAAMSAGGGLGLAATFGYLPAAALGLTAGVGTQGMLGSTKAARALVTPTAPRGLLDAPQMTPAVQELLGTSLQRAPIHLGLGLLTAPALE